MPIEFANYNDYEKLNTDDQLEMKGLLEAIKIGDKVTIINKSSSFEFVGNLSLSDREKQILLSAGLLNLTRKKANG